MCAVPSSSRVKSFMALSSGAAVGCCIFERKRSCDEGVCTEGDAPGTEGEAAGHALPSIAEIVV